MTKAVEACVHCGMCLPACPTYKLLGQEMDSPRGRIILMKEVLESALTVNEMMPHIDRCLGCVSCVTACPSGVEYGELLNSFRAHARPKLRRSAMERLTHLLVHFTLPYPARLRMVASAWKLFQPFGNFLPTTLAVMVNLLPKSLPPPEPLPKVYQAHGLRKAKVALLAGCVQQVVAPQINWATLRVLARNGVEVVIPRAQGCCGALAIHTGDIPRARAMSRRNLQVFPTDVDAIITNAAGCGSGINDYSLLFKDQPEHLQATDFAERVQDISVFLDELGIDIPDTPRPPLRLAHQDACHLAHAQGIWDAPRRLLQNIPNLSLIELGDEATCCGSAGTYNIDQPELAQALGENKARSILDTNADGVVTGNIGCIVQIRKHLQALGQPLPVYHTLEVLDQAYAPIHNT